MTNYLKLKFSNVELLSGDEAKEIILFHNEKKVFRFQFNFISNIGILFFADSNGREHYMLEELHYNNLSGYANYGNLLDFMDSMIRELKRKFEGKNFSNLPTDLLENWQVVRKYLNLTENISSKDNDHLLQTIKQWLKNEIQDDFDIYLVSIQHELYFKAMVIKNNIQSLALVNHEFNEYFKFKKDLNITLQELFSLIKEIHDDKIGFYISLMDFLEENTGREDKTYKYILSQI